MKRQQGGREIKISNGSVLKKIVFLLICAALMTTCMDCVAASSTAGQVQTAQISVTRDGVSYDMNQQQAAAVDNGEIEQASMVKQKVVYDKNGNIKKVTLKMRQVQEVDSSSTDDSTNAIDLEAYQYANIATTENGANIGLEQAQLASEESGGEIKQKQVTVIKVKFKKDGVKTTVKMKQKQQVK